MARSVVQLLSAPPFDTSPEDLAPQEPMPDSYKPKPSTNAIYAVCFDGSVWMLRFGGPGVWTQLPEIPT